ncbi:transposase [Myxococcota bacterium]
MIGQNFQGVLTTDRGGEYDSKKLETQRKQKCNTHLKRNICLVLNTQAIPSARRFGEHLRSLLDEARKLRRSYDRGHRRGYQAKVAKLEARMTHCLRPRKLTDPDNQRLLNQIGRQHRSGHVLRFLHDTTLSPDNHLAEQQIRPAVIARKVSHCAKTDAGADARGVHSTVYQTENRAQRYEKTRGSILDRVIKFFRPRSAASQAHAPSTTPPPQSLSSSTHCSQHHNHPCKHQLRVSQSCTQNCCASHGAPACAMR